MRVIGIISDTHGLVRPEAIAVLRGVELIIHAGDIGKGQVITELEALAPVVAVRGNCDQGAWAEPYPLSQRLAVGEVSLLVVHDVKELEHFLPEGGVKVVVSGHTHKPLIETKDGILYINPGSAGRRRFKLPVTVALLKVVGQDLAAEIIDLSLARRESSEAERRQLKV